MTLESKSMLLECIVEQIDIPSSYYAKAAARHKSLGEWLCRPESTLVTFNPAVHLQGSFRYGTVTRPLNPETEYDLDNVTTLQIGKTVFTQRKIKEMFGIEIRAYADAHGMTASADERNRCWRLRYADEVLFHLDALPCLPEDPAVISALLARNVPMEWARRAVAITDKRHPDYDRISSSLLSSNPRGFAHFFTERARPAAVDRIQKLVEKRLYASVEAVPPYEWQTPLQKSIQLLKRHRDVMFKDDPAVAPISMIITNLAARAFQGESELWSSLVNIVSSMPYHIGQVQPYVPNPANPNEDYADRWTKCPELKFNFETWLKQVTVDMERISRCNEGRELRNLVRKIFSVELPANEIRRFEKAEGFPAKLVTASPIAISQPPKPWGQSLCSKRLAIGANATD